MFRFKYSGKKVQAALLGLQEPWLHRGRSHGCASTCSTVPLVRALRDLDSALLRWRHTNSGPAGVGWLVPFAKWLADLALELC